jgi:hypothetical protein
MISTIGAGLVMANKEIDPDFFSLLIVSCPVVNTVIAIRYSDWRKTIDKFER